MKNKDKTLNGLKVIGKVSKTLVKKFFSFPKENQGWFFVSYAPKEYPIKHVFDSYKIENEIRNDLKIKIVEINLGFVHDDYICHIVPEGYKTICKFEFEGDNKEFLKNLKTISEFYSDKSIIIF